jgi:hypothetical protein
MDDWPGDKRRPYARFGAGYNDVMEGPQPAVPL